MLLAIDTATTTSSISLYDGQLISEYTWRTGRNHSSELLESVDKMLGLTRTSLNNLDGVVVTIGPGSFNGVRVGVTTAKMICLSLNLLIIGVTALEVVTYPHFHCQENAIRPMVEAGRGRFCTSLYQRLSEGWQETEEAHIVSPELLVDSTLNITLVCGDIDRELGARLMAQTRFLRVASPASGARRAAFLAEIGWERLLTGKGQRPEDLQAVYLSGPVARSGESQSPQMARIRRAISG